MTGETLSNTGSWVKLARPAAALGHSYICHIHEVGEAEAQGYIAMEYVDGQSLKERLAPRVLPLKEALLLHEAPQALPSEVP